MENSFKVKNTFPTIFRRRRAIFIANSQLSKACIIRYLIFLRLEFLGNNGRKTYMKWLVPLQIIYVKY